MSLCLFNFIISLRITSVSSIMLVFPFELFTDGIWSNNFTAVVLINTSGMTKGMQYELTDTTDYVPITSTVMDIFCCFCFCIFAERL